MDLIFQILSYNHVNESKYETILNFKHNHGKSGDRF